MALIDQLPQFTAKPLELTVPVSKLRPRPRPVVAEEPTPPVGPPTLEEHEAEKTMFIPDRYAAYEPLIQALGDSSIVSPDARAAVIAQMGLERGWTAPEDNNYGNITVGSSWKGKSNVRGDKDAEGNPITQNFRTYGSAQEFVDDYVSLLKNLYPRAYNELISEKFNIENFVSGLVDDKYKYATDPNYKNAVRNTYNSVIKHFIENRQ